MGGLIMQITNLIDNVSYIPELKSEHGLSYYIETTKHKILFDTGQSSSFIDNAKVLNIDLSQVDIVIISHGHYDHGGGLNDFLKINHHAKVYVNQFAFQDYYSKNTDTLKYIGLDQNLSHHPQIVSIHSDTYVIDDSLILYSGINQLNLSPLGNSVLVEKRGIDIKQDTFQHEQNLVIREDDNVALIAGCAHNGILNILQQITSRSNFKISHVFGGFHLYNLTKDLYEDEERILQLGNELLKFDTIFYTGHCTGVRAFDYLKRLMKEKIEYNSVGTHRII